MDTRKKLFIVKTTAILSVIPVLLFALQTGPDPGNTGVPGEGLCSQAGCHAGTPNSGPGNVRITLPGGNTYVPGVKQRISVTVSDPTPTQRRWGFQATARVAGSPSLKTQAGNFEPVNSFTQRLCSTATLLETNCNNPSLLQFIEHTLEGTRLGTTGGATFEFDWTPPATDVGNVIIYVAGNAANGDSVSDQRDRIYTTNVTLTPSTISGGAKPAISQNGVVNGASFRAGIAQNTWVTIQGSNLAANTRIWEGRDFSGNSLPTRLDGVSVKINNRDAFVYYISPTQLNVLAPVDSSLGPVQVQVTTSGGTSDAMPAEMARFSPAFFIFNNDKYIAATHADGSLLGPTSLFTGSTTPARPGEVITLYGSGFGETTPPIPNGQIVSSALTLVTQPTIRMGSTVMSLSFGGVTAAGLYQFNVTVPADAPNGDQPVTAEIGGITSAANAFITVQR